MRKKTTKNKQTIFNNKKVTYFVLSIVLILIVGSSFIAGYYVATNNKIKVEKKEDKTKEALKELQNLVDKNINPTMKSQSIIEKNTTKIQHKKVLNSEVVDYQENSIKKNEEVKQIKPVIYTTKPKLVIIMDDMSFYSQMKSLIHLHIKITPSFFPPSKRHPNTAVYAKNFKHYMVHFPMQATNPNFKEEVNTIHIDSDYQFIEQRVKFIKEKFPRVKFVNNHTGSKFTSNYYAMNKLYKILDKYHIIFIDSRTTSQTKAPLLSKKYNQILLSRDVFLDNKPNITYIQNQLQKAVNIAKKRGYAIAICHPHSKTFEALSKSKKILKNVEVVYIDELYKLYAEHKLSKL